ncbi:MAG: leucyl aminopeptidase [Pseudomonadota bacterium]
MKYSVSGANVSGLASSCVIAAITRDGTLGPATAQLDASLDGAVRRIIDAGDFKGKLGDTFVLSGLGGSIARVVLTGVGEASELDAKRYRRALIAGADAAAGTAAEDVTLLNTLEPPAGMSTAEAVRLSVECVAYATYRFTAFKSKGAEAAGALPSACTMLVAEDAVAEGEQGLAVGDAVAAGVALARDLGNMPANACTPTYLAETAQRIAADNPNMTARALDQDEIEELGMGSFLSVTQGSREPPKLIIMEYKGGQEGDAPVALVGKGITFDTGGICIKPAPSMDEMKYDMCGAAGVLGTMQSVARLSPASNVVAIVPACENMPDGLATRPGDIVTAMDGQTIEILNTDAEGRLILCDAICYAKRYNPDVIVDVATLTGACVIALGEHYSGLMSNDDALAEALMAAGRSACDVAWRLPMEDDYAEVLKSNFADFANVGGRPGGAITAACFLHKFARDQRWAHLDIAGSAWKGGKAKGGTGRPVSLLMQYILDRLA